MKTHLNDYNYWSKRAGIFDKASCDMDGKCSQDNKMDWVIRQFNNTDTTLEIGCGTGIYSALIANNVKSLVATDMSNEMLALTRTKLNQYANVEIRREDCYAISYKDNTFDSILLANLIHIVTDPLSVLKESRRVLKKGGRIIVISYTFYGLSLIQKIIAILHYMKNFGLPPSSAKTLSPEDLTKISEDAGFSVKESKLMGDKLKTVCPFRMINVNLSEYESLLDIFWRHLVNDKHYVNDTMDILSSHSFTPNNMSFHRTTRAWNFS